MIDLSHLTEEEQGMIMTVLKRDSELKKAEEERIRELQTNSPPTENRLKYLTGEWFYEAKSRRHRDKIHGSEIILASMKQKRGTLDGSLKAVSSKATDIVAPPKPARRLELSTQPQENRETPSFTDAEKEKLNLLLRSPGRPRHNPFNCSTLVLEAADKTDKQLPNGKQESLNSPGAESISSLKSHTTSTTRQNLSGSVTSEGSSVGFRPVPKKRTFLSRQQSSISVTESDDSHSGRALHPGSKVIVPAPRGNLQHAFNCGSNHSSQGTVDMQKTTTPVSESQNNLTPISPPVQPLNTQNQVSPKSEVTLISFSYIGSEREKKPPSITRERTVEETPEDPNRHQVRVSSSLNETEKVSVPLNESKPHTLLDFRPATHSNNDRPSDKSIPCGERSEDALTQRECVGGDPQARERSGCGESEPLSSLLIKDLPSVDHTHQQSGQNTAFQPTEIQNEAWEVDKEKTRTRNVGTAIKQEDFSLPQSIMDHQDHHELHNSGDKPDKHGPKRSGRKTSKSIPRSPRPAGEEGDSIAKVLEWFSRSTDSSDWLEVESDQPDTVRVEGMVMEDMIDSVRKDTENIFEIRSLQRERKAPEMKSEPPQGDCSRGEQSIGQEACCSPVQTPEVRDGSKPTSPMIQPSVQSPVNTERAYQPGAADLRRLSEAEKLRSADRKESKDVIGREEEVKKVSGGAQVMPKEVNEKEDQDENQPPKISHLKSFWEKGNTGPKILISRSNTSTEKGQKPTVQPTMEKEREETEKKKEKEQTEKPHMTVHDTHSTSAPDPCNVEGTLVSCPKDGHNEQRAPANQQEANSGDQSRQSTLGQEECIPKMSCVSAPIADTRLTQSSLDNNWTPATQNKEDKKHTAGYRALPAAPLVMDRRGSETEILSLTRLSTPEIPLQSRLSPEPQRLIPSRQSPQPDIQVQSRVSPEPQRLIPSRQSPQPDIHVQSRVNPQPVKLSQPIVSPQPLKLTPTVLSLQPEVLFRTSSSPQPENLSQAKVSPHLECLQGGESELLNTKPQQSSVRDDVKVKDEESRDRYFQSSVSLKNQDDPSMKDRGISLHTLKQVPTRQESMADKIKQLRSFWEQEKNKPVFYTGKSKGLADAKVNQALLPAPGKLQKRFTKSEYDLRSIGNESSSDHERDSNSSSDRQRQNFTVLTMNQRLEKSSPGLGANRSQFKNLREFWGEASSSRRGSLSGSISVDKSKNPKKKESIDAQPPMLEVKQCVDSEFYRKSTPSPTEKANARPPLDESRLAKSSPPPSLASGNKDREQPSRSPNDRHIGAGSRAIVDTKANLSQHNTGELEQQQDPRVPQLRRGSVQDSTREPQGNQGKESRLQKARKDSYGNSSARASALRRATSMFALNISEEEDKTLPGQLKKAQEVSPVQSKRTQGRRQSADSRASPRRSSRSSEDSESQALRARSFVPIDYRHYLGITEKTSVHTLLVPTVKQQEAESRAGSELDLSGPARTSTPVGSEEHYSRRGTKTTQRPLWVNHGSTDTGRESSASSTSDTWSNSRNSSTRETDGEDQNPVRKALRRAEARPKTLAKSLEDITASLPPRQERRQEPIVDLRRSSDASSIKLPSSSSFSDPEHLKKMSKSVPSFLQKENDGRDNDSTSEDSYHGGRRLMMGRSMTNFSTSSGMASVSSLSGSVMTMYSGDFGNVEVQGNIQFSINYVQKLKEFHIFVAQCKDLAAVDPKRGRSDPYVKSYLVPDKANLGKRKTAMKKKTLNPTFNEILRYRVRMEYLRTQTLILSVWHHDTFGKNSFLGEVDVDLSKWDFDHTQMNYLALTARPASSLQPSDDRGEMRLAIRFLPQIAHSLAKEPSNTGEVHIWVKDCKNLPLIRGATIDPYVKCFVLPDTSRKSRQKTRVLRRTVEPVFNHTMVYDGFKEEDLQEACVELTVWDRDRLASNLLGGLRLGPGTGRSYGAVVDWMDSNADEVALWERMIGSPNEWIEDVLPLRMLTTAKTALK